MGRCRHRPLQSATKIQRVLKGGQSRPPAGKCPFLRKSDANSQHFQWADVGIGPYDRQRKISRFCGRTESSAPTKGVENHAGHAKNRRVSRLYHRFSYVKYWPPPRCFRRKKSSGFANAGRIREIYILRCRGRCPHRPARNDRFMAVFRRNRVDFLFYAVGADDPVRPPETPVFTEIRCEIATFSMGRCDARRLVSRRNRTTRGS